MARGAKDYSNVRIDTVFHRVDDMAELAVRLGAPNSIDRLGSVALLEDFRHGILTIETLDGGLGGSVTASPLYSHYGGFTAKLTRIANANSYAGFHTRVAALQEARLGVEVLFCVFDDEPNLKLYLFRRTGTTAVRWGLRWDATTDKVYVGGDTEGWTEAATGKRMLYNYPMVHSMKLVGDEANLEYVRAIIDGHSIGLPEKDPYSWADAIPPNTMLAFYNGLGPAAASSVYVDVAMITQNEP